VNWPGFAFTHSSSSAKVCVDLGGVVLKDELRFAVGRFVALDRIAEIVGGKLFVHVGDVVGAFVRVGTKQRPGFLGGLEIFAVDPQQVDGACGFSGLFFRNELVDEDAGVHGHALQRDAVAALHFLGDVGIHPFVGAGQSAVHVKAHRGVLGLGFNLGPWRVQQGDGIRVRIRSGAGAQQKRRRKEQKEMFHRVILRLAGC
jgi:hypothetical protein